MMHGADGSLDIFCTLPPTEKERPDGVRRGWDGEAGFALATGWAATGYRAPC